MSAEPLTVDQVREGLAAHGIRLDERDDACSCPVCDGLMTLTVTTNGAGAHVECSAGCHEQAILGAVRIGLRMAQQGGTHSPLRLVRDRLALPGVERIVKRGKLGDSYELRMADGQVIELGNAAALLNQATVRARLLPQMRRLPPWIKGREWDAVVEAIEQAAEEIDNVATDAEETRAWLVAWLRQARYPTIDTADTAALYEALGSPPPAFCDQDGRLHVQLGDLATWINRFTGTRVTMRTLSARLAALDFERTQAAARHGGHVRNRRYWASPEAFEVSE